MPPSSLPHPAQLFVTIVGMRVPGTIIWKTTPPEDLFPPKGIFIVVVVVDLDNR
jgi:hypothetical protein